MTVLSLHQASKSYDGAAVLDQVTLEFPPRLITAVIGPSGCGKSTLLRLCNGLIRPDSGEVRVFGAPMDYARLPALRRRMGYAVQGTGLFPHLSAADNITLLARLEGWREADIRRRLEELLALCHLHPQQLQRYPHQLSGGQQQRVGLCRAMMLRPEVLLLDEPFAAIDPLTRSDIQRQLLELHCAEPVTTVLVTHDMREALLLADHIVILAGGRLIHADSTAALSGQYPGVAAEDVLRQLLQDAAA